MSLFAVAKILLEDMNLTTEERIQAERELLKIMPFDKTEEEVDIELNEVRNSIKKQFITISI